MLTNFVRLCVADESSGTGFHEYSVTFSPAVDSREVRFRLLRQHAERFPARTFDGGR